MVLVGVLSGQGAARIQHHDFAAALLNALQTVLHIIDIDGIVCIPPVGRESSASDRLLNLLADAYGTDWSSEGPRIHQGQALGTRHQ